MMSPVLKRQTSPWWPQMSPSQVTFGSSGPRQGAGALPPLSRSLRGGALCPVGGAAGAAHHILLFLPTLYTRLGPGWQPPPLPDLLASLPSERWAWGPTVCLLLPEWD